MEINNKWYSSLLTPQVVTGVIVAMAATIIFWYRTKDSWDVAKNAKDGLLFKVDKTELENIDEKVIRQWNVYREDFEKLNSEILELKLWKAHEEGRQEGIKQKQ